MFPKQLIKFDNVINIRNGPISSKNSLHLKLCYSDTTWKEDFKIPYPFRASNRWLKVDTEE